ncbi:MAG TPA: hypothetical protein DIW61_01980 [Candidatus Aminicenantes bacterium]|nr:hypothetical protein [Candidatus Aminicenantes bacterium]
MKESGEAKMLSGALPNGTYYLYSFDGRLLAEYSVFGYWVRDYIYFGGQLVAEYRATDTVPKYYYYAADQINSTRIVTDSTGTVVYSAAHEPYGGIQKTWASGYDPELKFSGKQRDAESDLDYFGARYYDRGQYRFVSVDPYINLTNTMNDLRRLNLYAYCGNNPIVFVDPDGLSYLEYYHLLGELHLYSGEGNLIAVFPAANNCSSNPFPQGTWAFERHSDNWITYWPGIDCMGNFIFAVEGHVGMGVHAHEEQLPPGWDYKRPTGGCISTTHDAMVSITSVHETDPLTRIFIERLDPIVPGFMTIGLPFTFTVVVTTPLPASGRVFSLVPPARF